MDNAWKFFKQIVLILLLVYLLAFLFETNFLIDLSRLEPKFDTSRYFYKIFNLE